MRGEWREGFYFAVSLSSQGAYNDIDKALLSRMVSDTVAGIYGAAYRLIDAAFIPVRALLYASYPRFFQEGGKGLASAGLFARRLLLPAFIVIFGVAVALGVLAPWIPEVLGEDFRVSSEVLLWLLPILFFRVLHYLPADALTGSGYQGLRTAVQLGVAGLNLALNLWLIPLWGWKGAVMASWISDGILALALWILLMVLSQREHFRMRRGV
jgi:O-antigen/teichoic acid export membrane protein